MYNCTRPRKPIISLNLSQADESVYQLPPNSFHFSRINESILPLMTVNGSNCYRWRLEFEENVEIQFLLIDISQKKLDSVKLNPKLNITIKNR